MTSNVKGLDKLKQRLGQSVKDIEKFVGPAMEAGGEEIAAAARLYVPVKSGKLRASIKVGKVHHTEKGNLAVVVTAGDESTVVKGRSQNFQLARIIEFGTQAVPAQPFMLPASRRAKPGVMRKIRKAMREVIKTANGG